MGSLFRRGRTYWADLRAEGGDRISLRTRDAKVAARRLRAAELAQTDPTKDRAPRLLSKAIDYLIQVGCNDRSQATRDFYGEKGRHLIRVLGDIPIETIDRPMVAGYTQTRIAEGAHPNTIGKELICLRRVLNEQHELVPLPRPPAEILIKWRSQYKPITRNLTPQQFAALLGAAPEKRRLWLVLAVYTGANLSEIQKIDRAGVDLVVGVLRIPGTKRQARNRLVPIPPPLRPWLERHMLEHRDAGGAIAPGPIVAPWPNPTNSLGDYCRKANVPRVTSNDLRRTYGSWLKQAGVDSKAVADLMGHASTRMVDQVYGRLTPEVYAKAVGLMPGIHVVQGEQLALPIPTAAALLTRAQLVELGARAISAVDRALIDLAEAAPIGMIEVVAGVGRPADRECVAGVSETALLPPKTPNSKPPRRRRTPAK